LKASAFNQLGQYTSSPGRRGYRYCYTELASSMAVTIASTHCAYQGHSIQCPCSVPGGYPQRDGQAKLAWVAGYVVR